MRSPALALLGLLVLSACASSTPAPVASPAPTQPPAVAAPAAPTRVLSQAEADALGERLYQDRCSTCHEAGRAPPRSRIAANTPQEILEALDTGFMASVAMFMTADEKTILARHLSASR